MALTDSLISYWSLDEASGDALDAHGTNDLTDTNTVGSATGKISNARDFEKANMERFSHADNADLSTGDIDFAFACWVNAESLPGLTTIASKGNWNDGTIEWSLDYYDGGPSARFFVSPDGSQSVTVVSATNQGALSLATWYFIVVWHDATANTINIQVNDGTVNSTSHTTGLTNLGGGFHIGDLDGLTAHWDGLIDEAGLWKRVLTSGERTQLYNSGNGLAYADFGGGAAGHPAMRRFVRDRSGLYLPRHRPIEIGRAGVMVI